MDAKKLFKQYLSQLKMQCIQSIKIDKQVRNLSWSDWNFYFFTRLGVKYYQVWCNRMGGFKKRYKDRLVPLEFLWDLGWFQRDKVLDKTGIEFCALALEQEKSGAKIERWIDFDKLLFADVTQLRVFIGEASNKEFKSVPSEYGMYYKNSKCRKGRRQFLLILFNQSSKGLRIGGWLLDNNGVPRALDDQIFGYPGII